MAPTKRAGPAFSPPRPGKKASTSKPTSNPKASTSSASTKKKRSQISKPSRSTSKRPRRTSLSPSASADPSDPSEDAASQESDPDSSDSQPNSSPIRRSPSPDHVLVELLPPPGSPTTASETLIPPQLLHHIATQHFSRPEKTKISEDARTLLGRYVDTFVREGIMRCAFERGELDPGVDGGAVGTEGWLEVGDLERVGVQLVLDF